MGKQTEGWAWRTTRGRHPCRGSGLLGCILLSIEWIYYIQVLSILIIVILWESMSYQSQNNPYYSKQPFKMHELILLLLKLSDLTETSMPTSLIRKISMDHGLQINEQMLAKMIAHLCDLELHKLIKSVKQDKTKSNKKNMNSIEKTQISKALYIRQLFTMSRPNIYPIMMHSSKQPQRIQQYIAPQP